MTQQLTYSEVTTAELTHIFTTADLVKFLKFNDLEVLSYTPFKLHDGHTFQLKTQYQQKTIIINVITDDESIPVHIVLAKNREMFYAIEKIAEFLNKRSMTANKVREFNRFDEYMQIKIVFYQAFDKVHNINLIRNSDALLTYLHDYIDHTLDLETIIFRDDQLNTISVGIQSKDGVVVINIEYDHDKTMSIPLRDGVNAAYVMAKIFIFLNY